MKSPPRAVYTLGGKANKLSMVSEAKFLPFGVELLQAGPAAVLTVDWARDGFVDELAPEFAEALRQGRPEALDCKTRPHSLETHFRCG